MSSPRLTRGREVLSDTTYLSVCRGVLSFRALGCALVAAVASPSTAAPMVLLAVLTAFSLWGMLSDGFVRTYFRHPAVATADAIACTLLTWLEWPSPPVFLCLVLTSLLVGLVLTPWLGLPALLLTLGTITLLTASTLAVDPGQEAQLLAFGLPLTVIGTTALGWTIRYAFVELKQSRDRHLATEVVRRHQAERARLARDMHDSLGKTVNGISLAAKALESASLAGDHASVTELAREVHRAAQTAADESRALLRGLRRGQDDRPTAEILGELARSRATPDLAVRTEVRGIADLPPLLSQEVVSIAEEALENVVRHARASEAVMSLVAHGEHVTLTVADDGRGFDTTRLAEGERAGHFGLRGMRERAAHTGGECTITAAPGAGTTIRCDWTLADWKEQK